MERAELIAGLRDVAGTALVERGDACFLVDPQWGERERAQWEALAERRPVNWDGREGWLCIPTGGSSGAMKLARHDERTLGAAVAGFCAHFGVERVDAVGLLPMWHVSGLMAWARCAWTGGDYRAASWKNVEAGRRPEMQRTERQRTEGQIPENGRKEAQKAQKVGGTESGLRAEFLSLVPTQLARLLGNAGAEAWLREFRAVFVGGGPAWPELVEAGRAARLPLSFSYGMTETAAMVAALRPEEFLAGGDGVGMALPHARIATDTDGRLVIEAASLFYGYWPETRAAGPWRTEDLGEMDAAGRLRVLGRADGLIITGGEKVDQAEVAAALRGVVPEVEVVGVPHPEWGSEVVALYPLAADAEAVPEVVWRAALAGKLAPAKVPKRLVAVPAGAWPRNGMGKVNRVALADLARAAGRG
jgi:O-succinylbenzoic acid--CoA ligase